MAASIRHNYFPKLLVGMTLLLMVCAYSCNDTATKEEKKDSTAAVPQDTTMKMKADSAKTDTSGKGGQPSPSGH